MRQRVRLLLVVAWLPACLPGGLSCTPKPPPEPPVEEPDAGELDDYVERPDAGELASLPPALEAAFTRSAEAKIDDALEDGGIPLHTAALYQLYAVWAPHLLPPALRSDPGLTLQPPPHVAWGVIAESSRAMYSAAELQNLDALRAKPGDPAFRNFTDMAPDAPRCTGSRNNAGAAYEHVIDTRNFSFYVWSSPATSGALTPAEARMALATKVRAALAAPIVNRGAVPSQNTFAEYLDTTYDFYVSLGLTPPMAPVEIVKAGGRIPISVLACDGLGEDATTTIGGEIYVTLAFGLEDEAFRHVVLPHEIVHVFQLGTPILDHHRDWPWEAMAVALEDVVARDVKRWSQVPTLTTSFPQWFQAMNRSFQCPEEPFHSNNHRGCRTGKGGAVLADRVRVRYAGDYSKFVFFKWLKWNMGDDPAVLGGWWNRYKDAYGDPDGLVPLAQLADFQLALLGDERGERPGFEVEDRSVFEYPAANLDPDTGLRQRYTFRFEQAKYPQAQGRLAPPIATTAGEPRTADSKDWPSWPGATLRIMVEIPKLPVRETFPGIPSVVWQQTGPKPELRARYFEGPPLRPTRKYYPLDSLKVREEEQAMIIAPNATRTVIITATMPTPTNNAKTAMQWGVTMGAQCSSQCGQAYKPSFDACCPESCAPEYHDDCIADCRKVSAYERSFSDLCAEYCMGKQVSYPVLFAGDNHSGAAGRICDSGGVMSCDTPSGLVPLRGWVSVSCGELGMTP